MSLETDFMYRERRKRMLIGLGILGVVILVTLLAILVQNPIG